MYQIKWMPLSESSYIDEADFIFRKWNDFEVLKFVLLVEDSLESISKTPTIGIYNSLKDSYSFVISKQTTLYYRVIQNQNLIELLLFWNNSQNPIHLEKLLK